AFCRTSRRAREESGAPGVDRAAVVLLIVYAIGFSVLAIDLIMSLEPRWSSTLFPAYVFTGNVYAGAAALAACAAWLRDASAVRLVAPIILVGLWLERWLLVAPDLPRSSVMAMLIVTAGFGAAFAFSVNLFGTRPR